MNLSLVRFDRASHQLIALYIVLPAEQMPKSNDDDKREDYHLARFSGVRGEQREGVLGCIMYTMYRCIDTS